MNRRPLLGRYDKPVGIALLAGLCGLWLVLDVREGADYPALYDVGFTAWGRHLRRRGAHLPSAVREQQQLPHRPDRPAARPEPARRGRRVGLLHHRPVRAAAL